MVGIPARFSRICRRILGMLKVVMEFSPNGESLLPSTGNQWHILWFDQVWAVPQIYSTYYSLTSSHISWMLVTSTHKYISLKPLRKPRRLSGESAGFPLSPTRLQPLSELIDGQLQPAVAIYTKISISCKSFSWIFFRKERRNYKKLNENTPPQHSNEQKIPPSNFFCALCNSTIGNVRVCFEERFLYTCKQLGQAWGHKRSEGRAADWLFGVKSPFYPTQAFGRQGLAT